MPVDTTGIERWRATCALLGLQNVDSEHRKLLRAWKSWGRHYHSQAHLEACLRYFSSAHFLATEPAEVELALWFHDAVYRTWRHSARQAIGSRALFIVSRDDQLSFPESQAAIARSYSGAASVLQVDGGHDERTLRPADELRYGTAVQTLWNEPPTRNRTPI